MFHSYFALLLSSCTIITVKAQQSEVSESILNEISFMFYGGETIYDYTTYPFENGLSILDHESYDDEFKSVFYMHGWSEMPTDHSKDFSIDILAKAFMKKKIANFIVINYGNLVKHYYNITTWTPELLNIGAGYTDAIKNVTQIGTALGKFFQTFVEECNCEDKLHLIGFSLGAQIMSYTAISYGQGKLKRLTALDAAGPLFEILGSGLSKKNGVFVDAIHTDAGRLGYFRTIGTADFYPNLGIANQPHCSSGSPVKCSHYMSVEYYAESVIFPKAFPAIQCANGILWTMNLCYNEHETFMGYHVDNKSSRTYFLNTNPNSPYGKGSHQLTKQCWANSN